MKRASQRHLPVYVSQISVTALLDLVLVLLLLFIVAVPLLRREKSVEKITATDSGKTTRFKSLIELRIHADQSIQLDGKKVSGEDLLSALKAVVSTKPEGAVLVKMPANFAAGSLARLMDEMHRAGIQHTAVEVIEETQP